MKKPRVLFILKKNECYGFSTYTRRSSGLWNSTQFIISTLNHHDVPAKIVEVADNNEIDREVSRFKPDLVVIEALWVVPEKFDVLKKLHPQVKWLCHLHSDMPFLALEGIAMDWILRYAAREVGIIANSKESYNALRVILGPQDLVYLPNVYLSSPRPLAVNPSHHKLKIGCFGAVRPLKNQLNQALAAIQFARESSKLLEFHMNTSRMETGGEPVMKNIRSLFESSPDIDLIENRWFEPHEFLSHLCQFDIGLQVSLTETFNVVSADYVTAGVPLVVSKEVKWASYWNKAKDNSVHDMVRIMRRVYRNKCLVKHNQRLLLKNSLKAQSLWVDFMKAHHGH